MKIKLEKHQVKSTPKTKNIKLLFNCGINLFHDLIEEGKTNLRINVIY
jgi:hypothetical protein